MFKVIPLNLCKRSLVRFSITAKANAHAAAPTAGGHHAVSNEFNRVDAYPRIGKREIVGFGVNGEPNYFDKPDCPCPAIRWKEDSDEIKKLREKAKGDWGSLTIQEKKTLYRADFRSTLAEVTAPDGEWKFTLGALLAVIGGSIWLYFLFAKTIYNFPRKETSSLDHQARMLERMIAEGKGRIHGYSAEWDYEKGDWKKNTKN